MKCPQCSKKVSSSIKTNKTKPFCSERCRSIDLGKWLDGDYRIPESEENLTQEDHAVIEKLKTESTIH